MAEIWLKNFARDSFFAHLDLEKKFFWKFLEIEFCSAISFLSD